MKKKIIITICIFALLSAVLLISAKLSSAHKPGFALSNSGIVVENSEIQKDKYILHGSLFFFPFMLNDSELQKLKEKGELNLDYKKRTIATITMQNDSFLLEDCSGVIQTLTFVKNQDYADMWNAVDPLSGFPLTLTADNDYMITVNKSDRIQLNGEHTNYSDPGTIMTFDEYYEHFLSGKETANSSTPIAIFTQFEGTEYVDLIERTFP